MSRDIPEIATGGIITLLGAAAVVGSVQLDLGTATNMGPGFFPLLISVALMLSGAVQVVLAFRLPPQDDAPKRIDWLPLLAISLAGLAFGLLIVRLGLVPAIVAAVLISALPDPRLRRWEVGALAIACCIVAWLVFSLGLGLTLPLFVRPAWI